MTYSVSNQNEVTTTSHYASSLQSPSVLINPDNRKPASSAHNVSYAHKVYFTTIKKQNTYYLRVFHRNQLLNESITVSLRTTERRTATMNATYLKDALLEKAGQFVDFSHMRAYIKELAKTELLRPNKTNVDWLYKGNIELAQEALQSATTVNQVRFIQSYSEVMKKGLHNDTEGLLSIMDSNDEAGTVSKANTTNSPNTIVSMIDDYITEKEVTGSWTKATLGTKAATVRKLVSYFEACNLESKPIEQITRQDLLEVRTALSNTGLKLSTVNGQIRNIVAVFKYAELLDVIPKSPAVKLLFKDREQKEAKALTEDQINHVLKYFREDWFSTKAKRSKKTIEAMKFIKWIPQIAAITGARLNEVLQLRKGDIKQSENGLCYYINISDSGDNVLKNSASARVVPLIDGAYGFNLKLFLEEIVNTCNADSDNIFRLDNNDRQLNSIKIGKIVKAYRDNHTEVPESLTMHSFRHSMATLCLNKKMPESFAKEILGHTQSITYGLYGSAGVDVERLYKEMLKLWSFIIDN
ncbi:tyrosine-type recombinase/integrase [Vibrio aestuarianus]|uniref:tyrosine-type recombinase/integrase n=1 Tax=Vibrio aestuarianus TaxID=28171 RepID=UPI0014468ED7|nr:tyrosine-type recombinase/integrase [Vibrio aestuarianus subsp. francensis]NOI62253.1 tyrosine-type recombinase/integrase [Vibrio aestuarianus]NLS49181.1 tyrosine-type recombinase/integrase [Vibrio aestuarianus subsp. francensis]NLS64430.1 tyrosine-type recombinase/integrase [Vibrio aestuarianus subsp. francensis]NLS81079.1 tyrosine-type recombinase/integrase [Vibrio aestuarianus subsp. francensis]